MPSSITHELIAESALSFLSEAGKKIVLAAPDYYYLGAQGPDVLFFCAPYGRGKNLGKLLHHGDAHALFQAMLRALKNRRGDDKTKCLSYALGFCSHYAADAVFHPFVYNYLRSHTRRFEHQQMENDWDVYFLGSLRGAFPLPYAYPFDAKKIAREGVLPAFLRECTSGVKPLDESAFMRGIIHFGRYLKFFHGRVRGECFARLERVLSFRGISVFYPRRTPDPQIIESDDFAVLSEGGGKNADELFSRAVKRSAELENTFLSAKTLPKALFPCNFEGVPTA